MGVAGRAGSTGPTTADDRVEARGQEQHGTGDDPLVARLVRTLYEIAHAVDDDRDDQAAENGVDDAPAPAE